MKGYFDDFRFNVRFLPVKTHLSIRLSLSSQEWRFLVFDVTVQATYMVKIKPQLSYLDSLFRLKSKFSIFSESHLVFVQE